MEAQGLYKIYDGFVANSNISFTLKERELVSIIGPNGAGKSTLFNMLSGSAQPDRGKLLFKGNDIIGKARHRFVSFGISKSHQITSLFLDSTVFDNVFFAIEAPARALNFWDIQDTRQLQADKIHELLNTVGLAGKSSTMARMLSHGEQRSLEIAVALASEPTLLLLDEPTAGMGPQETVQIISLIRKLRERLTIALVEHKMKMVMDISDRVLVLHHGELLAQGTPQEIAGNAEVKRVYLGEKHVIRK
ncbi:MAG TPA: ABC transporter ATP-binding protein [Eoetvoesiella sp.]